MTIKDIADLAGVSISTVSKIINNKADNINIETRNRVLKIVKDYNYTPYSFVKNSSSAKTFMLGILINQTEAPSSLLKGILHTAQLHGYNIMLCDSGQNPETELKHITALCRHHVDGVIWEPVNDSSLNYKHFFTEQQISVSYINTTLDSTAHRIDYARIGYAATQELIKYRHTAVGYLMNKEDIHSPLIFEGFKKCLFDHEIPYKDELCLDLCNPDDIKQLSTKTFTGFVSPSYNNAIAFYETAHQLHYHIPSDFSLISIKDDHLANVTYPCISSIIIAHEKFGAEICQRLIAQCENQPHEPLSFPPADELCPDHKHTLDLPQSCRFRKIVVVGSINTDTTLKVATTPNPGITTLISSSVVSLGGKGANQAVGSARLGRETALIGKIGNDFDSAMILETLKKENVRTEGISRTMDSPTGKAYIYLQKNAESNISVLPGANQQLLPQDIEKNKHLFENCGYCLISTEIPYDTYIYAVRTAKQYNATTIVKPATLRMLPDDLIQNTDIFIPNKNEARLLCPEQTTLEEQADYLLSKGCHTVIITLGNEGCYLKNKTLSLKFPASDFVSLDTTGGADAFISALAAYLTEGYDLCQAIPVASCAAGFCVSRIGVIPALIDKLSLENKIRQDHILPL